jgi:hypothetical protein
VLLYCVKQHRGLQPVSAGATTGFLRHPTVVDGRLNRCDDKAYAHLRDPAVPVVEYLRKVVPGVNVQDRERDCRRVERLCGKMQHDDRILAPREHQYGAFEFGGNLTDDVERLGLQHPQLRQAIVGGGMQRQFPQTTAMARWTASSNTLPNPTLYRW